MAGTLTRRRPSRLTSFAILVTACLLLYVSLPNLGRAIHTATVDGTPGTFTARRLQCVSHPGHESCGWSGTFRSRDRTLEFRSVTLYGSGRDSLRQGERVKAVDMGMPGRVYRPGGSGEWILVVLLLLAGYGLLALFAQRHLLPPPRSASAGPPRPAATPASNAAAEPERLG
ncbi:hypothetical protein ACOBQB_10935 [Streptomyces sp. G5(2025)]|uniref:hypothetical protein n=1 Tax=Streptomyces sp. G5(2025) TaxID=3406628 RepID=UPI003C269C19